MSRSDVFRFAIEWSFFCFRVPRGACLQGHSECDERIMFANAKRQNFENEHTDGEVVESTGKERGRQKHQAGLTYAMSS